MKAITWLRRRLWHHLRHVIEDHEMGFFEYMVVCPVGWSLNDVLRDSYVHPFQFRYVEPGLSDCPGRNFSEELVVVRVRLLEHRKSARCPYEVDASGCRVKLDFVGAAHAVQPLNHFSRHRIH